MKKQHAARGAGDAGRYGEVRRLLLQPGGVGRPRPDPRTTGGQLVCRDILWPRVLRLRDIDAMLYTIQLTENWKTNTVQQPDVQNYQYMYVGAARTDKGTFETY